MRWKIVTGLIAAGVLSASQALAIEWEVWLSDQSNSADISAENPTGTFGGRILVYDGRDILIAQPGTYDEDHPLFGPTVIEAADVFPYALSELGADVERLHGMLPHPSHRFMNANFLVRASVWSGLLMRRGSVRSLRPSCWESISLPLTTITGRSSGQAAG